jgi:hypothetical protein
MRYIFYEKASIAPAIQSLLNGKARPVIFIIGESHNGCEHERLFQEALINEVPAGTPVVIEENSFRDSLLFVKEITEKRGVLPAVMAGPSEKKLNQHFAGHAYAEGIIFEKSRSLIKKAHEQINISSSGMVFLFAGSGHLQEIDRMSRQEGYNITLINLAGEDILNQRENIHFELCQQLSRMGCPEKNLEKEVSAIMGTLDFPFNNDRVIQAGFNKDL